MLAGGDNTVEQPKKDGGGGRCGQGGEVRKEELETEGETEEEEEDEDGGEDDGDGGESSDDPDRLWCICQQPHDDRCVWCMYICVLCVCVCVFCVCFAGCLKES